MVDGDNTDDVHDQLKKAHEDMLRMKKEDREIEVKSLHEGTTPNPAEANGGFALVINGHSLVGVWMYGSFS